MGEPETKEEENAKQREGKEALPQWWESGGREKKGRMAPWLQSFPTSALAGPGTQGRNGKPAGIGWAGGPLHAG